MICICIYGYIYFVGCSLLPITEATGTLSLFDLSPWTQNHILRPGPPYYRADMGRAQLDFYWPESGGDRDVSAAQWDLSPELT